MPSSAPTTRSGTDGLGSGDGPVRDIIQDALRTHFGEPTYRPTDDGRAALVEALDAAQADPGSLRDWSDVRATLSRDH